MDLESPRPSFFTDDHVRALSLLAPQIATSVENARLYGELAQRERRMDQDLHAAFRLQSVLVPRTVSDVVGVEVGIKTRPARQISGDFYDFFEHSDEYTLIAFGDVSGKGAAAALYAALLSGLLRILAPQRRTPSELMKDLNEALLERKVDAQYATLSLITWAAKTQTFTVVSAGTLPPMLSRAGRIIEFEWKACPSGCSKARNTIRSPSPLNSKIFCCFYSDGVEDQLGKDAAVLDEATAAEKEMENYGRARLQKY